MKPTWVKLGVIRGKPVYVCIKLEEDNTHKIKVIRTSGSDMTVVDETLRKNNFECVVTWWSLRKVAVENESACGSLLNGFL